MSRWMSVTALLSVVALVAAACNGGDTAEGEIDPNDLVLCVESEFEVRGDGLPGMEEEYGFEFPNVDTQDLGLIYSNVGDGDCTFGEVFTSDGRIGALDLHVLEDDQGFFPLYNPAPVFREDAYEENADELENLFNPITEALDTDMIIQLNERVSADGDDPQQVAQDFLDEEGLLEDVSGTLDGADITVGSKDFDEQLLLGWISVLALQEAGANVGNEIDLGGTVAARDALEGGEIDHYWEYTGTAWIEFFEEEDPIPDEQEQYEAVRDRDREEANLVWLQPAPFNNTYALAMSQEEYERLGQPETLSDLEPLVTEGRLPNGEAPEDDEGDTGE